MTAPTTLAESAMLVTLTISQWTARKYDKNASKAVEAANDATNAGRFNKVLVAKEALEAINKEGNAARAYHYKMTLPWGDNGSRLLPSMLFSEYTDEMNKYRESFTRRVREFVRDYPQLREDARKRLGKMYNAMDYPDVSDIQGRFDISMDFDPVGTARDFRVQLNEEYASAIRNDITARMERRQNEAMKNCYERLKDVVAHIHERLADEDKTFRDTLISNAEELLKVLPALNITNDPALNALGKEVEEMLVHPDRLRNDKGLRGETAKKAADILAKFGMAL